MQDAIRLSAKEIPGLAARVFTSAVMPMGATGSASEAVEFLELTGQHGLAGLDREKDELAGAQWRAPAILEEGAGYAVCDPGASPAPYYFACLADWLAAMTADTGMAAIVLRHCAFRRYLHVVPYLLARRGLSSFVAERGTDANTASVVSTSAATWRYSRLTGLRQDAISMPAHLPGGIVQDMDVLLVGSRTSEVQRDLLAGLPAGHYGISSSEYAARKAAIVAEGWPVDRALWESLMRFADRSLIRTSERSRLGAG